MIDINLNGKTALVTGCDDPEAGKAAELLAQAGADVVLQYEKEENAVLTMVEKIRRTGRNASAFFAELKNYRDAEALTDHTITSHGKIDILINDIRLYSETPTMDLTLEQWEASLKRSLYGVFHISKAVSRFMTEKGNGTIVNITSAAPFSGLEGGVDLSAPAAAIHGMTLAMARELTSKGIRVNAIAPSRELFKSSNDIVMFAVYLSSPLAGGISGGIFTLNGIPCREGDD